VKPGDGGIGRLIRLIAPELQLKKQTLNNKSKNIFAKFIGSA
jgi:hypothetical protein